MRRRVAVVTTEPLSAELAGPAIRAVELGRVLATEHDVEVASTASCSGPGPDANWHFADPAALRALAARCDVMVLGGDVLAANTWLAEAGPAIVVDLYDPFHLEQLEQARDLGEDERRRVVFGTIDVLNAQAVLGDTFLCASGRQRDMWLGHLAACGRVNPATYDADPTLRSLLRVVPFGVADEPLTSRRARAARGHRRHRRRRRDLVVGRWHLQLVRPQDADQGRGQVAG